MTVRYNSSRAFLIFDLHQLTEKTIMNNLKDRIYAGETVHGCWINLGSTVSAEIVGRSGFDWLLIDLEHGAGDYSSMYQHLQVLANTEPTIIVRTGETSQNAVQHILDAGASGVMFPRIKDSDEATLAVRSMYYPPEGIRGMAKMVRATEFGARAAEYISSLERNLISVIQIETLEAIRNLDSIAAIERTDVLFVGPNDLSLALGIFGQHHHPKYLEAIRLVATTAKKHGKIPGVLLQAPSEYELYSDFGYRFLACGADATFVSKGAAEMAAALKAKRPNVKATR